MTINTDITYYVVFNDCGRFGIAETVISDRKTMVENIRRGELEYENVVKVLAFNAAEGWATDATDDVFADVEAAIQRIKDDEDFPVTAQARREREGV